MPPETTSTEYRKPLQWGEFDPNRRRNMYVGMWAWMWQRISALAIIVLLALHITLTYKPWLQFLLLLAVTFHAALGLRVILLDFNLVNVKYQRALIWGLTGLGLVVFVLIWKSVY
jgi:succinate dehydrogenase/fumarate reductase cytochrome b subunit